MRGRRRGPNALASMALLAMFLLAACRRPPQEIFREGMAAYQQGDYATALARWRPLAEAGDADAQTNVGLLYSQGKGVPQNAAEAFRWYRLAALQHHMDAQYNLALLYRDGKGVEPSPEEAARWFRYAAERGHLRAALRLADLYAAGTGVPEDDREAVRWYEMAADRGEPEAQLKLAEILARGDGVPPDRARAYLWYSAAVVQDYDRLIAARASMGRMRLLAQMDEVEIIEGERQFQEWRDIKRTEANQ